MGRYIQITNSFYENSFWVTDGSVYGEGDNNKSAMTGWSDQRKGSHFHKRIKCPWLDGVLLRTKEEGK